MTLIRSDARSSKVIWRATSILSITGPVLRMCTSAIPGPAIWLICLPTPQGWPRQSWLVPWAFEKAAFWLPERKMTLLWRSGHGAVGDAGRLSLSFNEKAQHAAAFDYIERAEDACHGFG